MDRLDYVAKARLHRTILLSAPNGKEAKERRDGGMEYGRKAGGNSTVIIGDNEGTSFYPQCLFSFPRLILMFVLVTKFVRVI